MERTEKGLYLSFKLNEIERKPGATVTELYSVSGKRLNKILSKIVDLSISEEDGWKIMNTFPAIEYLIDSGEIDGNEIMAVLHSGINAIVQDFIGKEKEKEVLESMLKSLFRL